jgi:endonuclease YncB( thermonuclease family)
MRMLRILSWIFLLNFVAAPTWADDAEISGTPEILPSGILILDERAITLWGIDMIAGNQPCWNGHDAAWNCGAQATTDLTNYAEGHVVGCTIKADHGGGNVEAQCFCETCDQPDDLARYMVSEGWALDDPSSGGLYAAEEEKAWRNGRGVWTSRFQMPGDWRNGVQRYVDYQPPATALIAPPVVVQNPDFTALVPGDVVIINNGVADHDHGRDKNRSDDHVANHGPMGTSASSEIPHDPRAGTPAGTAPNGAMPPAGQVQPSTARNDNGRDKNQ